MKQLLLIGIMAIVLIGCATTGMVTTSYDNYRYWTGTNYVYLNSGDYYYRIDNNVYHHHHSRNVDIIVRTVPPGYFVAPHYINRPPTTTRYLPSTPPMHHYRQNTSPKPSPSYSRPPVWQNQPHYQREGRPISPNGNSIRRESPLPQPRPPSTIRPSSPSVRTPSQSRPAPSQFRPSTDSGRSKHH